MNGRFPVSAIAIFGLVVASHAQSRMERIYGSMRERIVSQTDHWFDDGEFPRCIHLLRFHNEYEPNDFEVATNLGWLLESTEQWDEALATYVRYKVRNPSDIDASYPEANFYFMKKVYAKVPPLLEPTIAKKPHPNAYRILAHSYEKLGLLSDSKRVWDRYLKIAPDDGAAKRNRERVTEKLRGARKADKLL